MINSARLLGLTVVSTSGDEELVLCPLHSDTKPSAWFNPKRGLFFCAVCNLGLNAQQLAQRMGVEVDEEEDVERIPEDYCFTEEQVPYLTNRPRYHEYYTKRGICKETVYRYGASWLYAKPEAAILPITLLSGKAIGMQMRYLNPEESGTRYRTVGKTTPFWPLHLLQGIEQGQRVLVTEGAFSAMRIHTWGISQGFDLYVFALMGAKANQDIVDALRPLDAVLLYDSDKAGTTACKKMKGLWPTCNSWTLSTSPDDMEDEAITELLLKLKEKLGE